MNKEVFGKEGSCCTEGLLLEEGRYSGKGRVTVQMKGDIVGKESYCKGEGYYSRREVL